MLYIIYAIHVVICLFLIMVVLLQQGSGADLSVFGGGGTQTAFGARSATNLLHKLTVAGFVGFILTTIAFGFLKSDGGAGSVMSDVEQVQPAEAMLEDDVDETSGEAEGAVPTAAPDAGNGELGSAAAEANAVNDTGGTDETTAPGEPGGP